MWGPNSFWSNWFEQASTQVNRLHVSTSTFSSPPEASRIPRFREYGLVSKNKFTWYLRYCHWPARMKRRILLKYCVMRIFCASRSGEESGFSKPSSPYTPELPVLSIADDESRCSLQPLFADDVETFSGVPPTFTELLTECSTQIGTIHSLLPMHFPFWYPFRQ